MGDESQAKKYIIICTRDAAEGGQGMKQFQFTKLQVLWKTLQQFHTSQLISDINAHCGYALQSGNQKPRQKSLEP